jgi:hypothetical protein
MGDKAKKQIKDILDNTKEIFMSDSALETLMDFERVLDELDLYVFKNWKTGELVEGPLIEKYFVTCTFMWPDKNMPDPAGGQRLLGYDIEVYFEQSKLAYPRKIKSNDDYEPGNKMPKMSHSPVWLVTIVMPKKLMQDIQKGSVEIEGENLDLEDIEKAYETDADENEFDDDENVGGDISDQDMTGGTDEQNPQQAPAV